MYVVAVVDVVQVVAVVGAVVGAADGLLRRRASGRREVL